MKTLSIYVYRSATLGDCTNHGISSKHDKLYIECKDGPFDADEQNPPENLVKLVYRRIGNKDVYHIEPVKAAAGAGWMAGGNYAGCSDSRFSAMTGIYGAISIHDRDESWQMYERMSR